jgi:hypothetical protein
MKSNHQRYAGRGANEAGPSRHIPIQGFRLYTREPKRAPLPADGGGKERSDRPTREQAAAVDVPALRDATGRRARGGGHVRLAVADLTHFPAAWPRR